MKILVRDQNYALTSILLDMIDNEQSLLDGSVEIDCGSIFRQADDTPQVIVSPANSFGFMDGGIDAVYADRFEGIGDTVRGMIAQLPFGELLVGQAMLAPIHSDPDFRVLIVAPTMRLPERIRPRQVYMATRAAVGAAMAAGHDRILMPGMGTGAGGVDAEIAAQAMIQGIIEGLHGHGPKFSSWREAVTFQEVLESMPTPEPSHA